MTICDNCNKEIQQGLYFEVMTGHHQWGNDSIESIKHFNYCSKDCLDVKYHEYMCSVRDTYYFEIEVNEK